jgi:hypothetical protein
LTVDDNGLLTVSGATLTMDQLIIDSDNTEAVLIRKDGDAGDIFIVDTINETVVVSGTTQTGFPPDTRTVLIDTAARKVTIFGTQGGFLLEGRTANTGFAPAASFTNDVGGLDRGTSIELGITTFPMAAIGGAMSGSTAEGYMRLDSRTGGVLSEKVRIAPDGSTIHGLQLLSPIDAIVLDSVDLTGDGQQDSHAIVWTGKGFETSTPHDIDWKAFVDVTANDGTGSIWTLQSRIDAASFVDEFTVTSTTSPTLVNVGPGSTGGAIAFGPIGTVATQGTLRFQNVDTIFMRNANDNNDINILSSPMSDEFLMFGSDVPRVTFQQSRTTFNQEVQIALAHSATNALQVGAELLVDTTNNLVTISNLAVSGTLTTQGAFIIDITDTEAFLVRQNGDTGDVFIIDTTNEIIKLAQDDTVLAWGAASDVQLHRGDGPDILEQRRGANDQRFNLYDNFVSNADYDRLAFYIGGGPPVITAEIAAETTNGAQRIDLVLESAGGDSNMTFRVGSTNNIRLVSSGLPTMQFTPTEVWDIGRSTTVQPRDLHLFRRLQIGLTNQTAVPDAIRLSSGGVASPPGTLDSHGIEWTGHSNDGSNHPIDFRVFVNVVNNDGSESIMKVQSQVDTAGFADIVHMVDGGRFAIVQPEQVSIGSATFIDNAQVHITGAFIDDYGGGPTSTHKILVDGSLTGDATRTTALNIAEFSGSVITQTATENISTVSQVEINEPNITDNLTGSITSAQSLLITGAPTEGVSNYALRLLAGDLIVDDAAAILFKVGGSDLSALSVAPTGRLELGLSGAPWGRINLYSQIINNIGGDLRIVATAANHSAETQMQVTFADVATSAGSSVFAAGLIPAGSFVIGVTVRVLTTVTGPTGFDVGDGSDVDRWGNSILVAAGTVTNIQSFTTGAVTTFQFANDVRLTSDGVDFTGGSVRITVHYTQLQTSAA